MDDGQSADYVCQHPGLLVLVPDWYYWCWPCPRFAPTCIRSPTSGADYVSLLPQDTAELASYFDSHTVHLAARFGCSSLCFSFMRLLMHRTSLPRRCHLILASLRKPGDKEYKIPKGFLFNYITCANYTAEILGWMMFGIATQTMAAFLFITAGASQMAIWALQKHKRMLKQFDGKDGREKYPKRWIMLPPFF